MRTVGEVIREWRTEREVTQEQLERMTGFRQTYLSALERDRFTEPGFKKLGVVVRALGHSLDELLDEVARRQPVAA